METIGKAYEENKDIFLALILPSIIWLLRPLLFFLNPARSETSRILTMVLKNDLLMYCCAFASIAAFVFALLKSHESITRREQHLRAFFLILSFSLCLLSLFSLV